MICFERSGSLAFSTMFRLNRIFSTVSLSVLISASTAANVASHTLSPCPSNMPVALPSFIHPNISYILPKKRLFYLKPDLRLASSFKISGCL